jgi:phosphoribosyl 1,2-cyclic phosphodiesterase
MVYRKALNWFLAICNVKREGTKWIVKFSVLASGSSGNSLYIDAGESRFLVDAGLSTKQLEQRLQQMNVELAQLTAIFVTHEHIDHVKGLGVLARRYPIPIYMNEATWKSLPANVGEIPELLQHVLETGSTLELSDVRIESIPVSHDAAEPIGFRFLQQDQSLAIVTDLGYVNQRIIDQVAGVDTLIWESNHDVAMLRVGSYPWNTKRRILSDVGHLSNEDAGAALTEIVQGLGEHIYLAHLSKDNNIIELAHLTVKSILEEAGYQIGRDLHLWPTFADRPTPIREVKMKR